MTPAPRSIHTPEPVGIDDTNLQASSKGLRVTLVIPSAAGPLSPADVPYWEAQVMLFDESRRMLGDLKMLTRALRNLPEEAHTDETRACLERMKELDTEVKP